MADDYTQHPQSISEARSAKSGSANDWTPRDVLIATLREIDSGEIAPTALVLCMKMPGTGNGSSISRFRCASPDPHITLGLLAKTMQEVVVPVD